MILPSGSLVLISDGVFEAANGAGEQFDAERDRGLLAEAELQAVPVETGDRKHQVVEQREDDGSARGVMFEG